MSEGLFVQGWGDQYSIGCLGSGGALWREVFAKIGSSVAASVGLTKGSTGGFIFQ